MRKILQAALLASLTLLSVNLRILAATNDCVRIDLSSRDTDMTQNPHVEQHIHNTRTGRTIVVRNQLPFNIPTPSFAERLDLPSPDNRYNAILLGDDGVHFHTLYLQNQQTHRRLMLQEPSRDNTYNIVAAWSPDGKELAYLWQVPTPHADVWDTRIHLTVVNADGTHKRQVTLPEYAGSNLHRIAWSADQKYLSLQLVAVFETVYLVSTDSLQLQKLSVPLGETVNNPSTDFAEIYWLEWASQGHRFAVTTDKEIVFVSPDQSMVKHAQFAGFETYVTPVWSSDGQYIAIMYQQTITIFNTDGTVIQTFDGEEGDFSSFYWLGDKLLFVLGNGIIHSDLFMLSPQNRTVTKLATDVDYFGVSYIAPFIILSSGDLLVVKDKHSKPTLSLVKGEQFIKIADGFDFIEDVQQSSDGKYIVFVMAHGAYDSPDSRDIMWIKTDGTGQQAFSAEGIRLTGWFKDEDTFFYVERQPGNDTTKKITGYLVNAATGTRTALLKEDEVSTNYSLVDSPLQSWVRWIIAPSSPDGPITITYRIEQPLESINAVLVARNGTTLGNFTDGWFWPHSWSPDGTKLIYVHNIDTRGDLSKNNTPEVQVLSADGTLLWKTAIPDDKRVEDAFWVQCS